MFPLSVQEVCLGRGCFSPFHFCSHLCVGGVRKRGSDVKSISCALLIHLYEFHLLPRGRAGLGTPKEDNGEMVDDGPFYCFFYCW